jgi:hypothetical protein
MWRNSPNNPSFSSSGNITTLNDHYGLNAAKRLKLVSVLSIPGQVPRCGNVQLKELLLLCRISQSRSVQSSGS